MVEHGEKVTFRVFARKVTLYPRLAVSKFRISLHHFDIDENRKIVNKNRDSSKKQQRGGVRLSDRFNRCATTK